MRGGSRQERRWSNCIGCWFVVVNDVVVVFRFWRFQYAGSNALYDRINFIIDLLPHM